MVKVSTLPTVTNPPTSSQFNDAMSKITTAFSNTLSRDGSTPNTLSADLDLNGNDVINVTDLSVSGTISVNGATLQTSISGSFDFATRAEFVTWNTDANKNVGMVVNVAGLSYRYNGTATTISDLLGWVPNGYAYPDHWGDNTTPGTTNCTNFIQSAHDYVETTGGILKFKPTIYAIGSTLTWRADTPVQWEGEGFYFLNDYTDSNLIMKGSVIKLLSGSNCDMLTVRSSTTGWVSGYPRVFGSIKKLCFWGNKSLDDLPTAVDLNSTGNGIRLQGVSYFTMEDCLVYRAPQTGILTESYDYSDGGGARSCNNLAFTRVVAIGCGGNGMELYGGDSAFSDLVCGYNGLSGANISAGPVTNSLFWNNQQRGLIVSSGVDGIQVSNCWAYDNKYAGYYFSAGGDHSLTGSRATNNGRIADANANNQCGVLVSASIGSLTITGCVITDTAGTQLRGVYTSGTPAVNLGSNELDGPTADLSFGAYTSTRYHNQPLSSSVLHPGFTAEGIIFRSMTAPATVTGAATLTNANITPGVILYTGAAANLTMPLGSTLDSIFTVNDIVYEFSVINTGSGTATIITNTGVTVGGTGGSMAVAAGSTGRFAVRRTAASTYVVYRVG